MDDDPSCGDENRELLDIVVLISDGLLADEAAAIAEALLLLALLVLPVLRRYGFCSSFGAAGVFCVQ